jgi:hypothetical protein
VHQEAHYDLELYGEVVSENKKVTDFLRGISDPTCRFANGIVLATPDNLNNFTKAALYVASTLNVTLINANQKQNISNTCCLGATYHDIEYTGQVCEVHPYHLKYKPTLNVPVVKGVTAYDDE